jgi:hypothetical protein
MVLQTLDAIQALGFTVVRIWAFNDGPGWMSLQPQAGESAYGVLKGLSQCLLLGLGVYCWHMGGLMMNLAGCPCSRRRVSQHLLLV